MDLNEEFYLELIKGSAKSLHKIPEELKENRKFILKAADIATHDFFAFFDCLHYTYRADKELFSILVKKDGIILNYASDKLRNDKEIALIAFNANPDSIFFFSDELRTELQQKITKIEVIQYLETCILEKTLQTELANNNITTKKLKV